MELIKRNIHMNRQKCRGQVQVTLDNDINVPDVKPDIKKIITEQGDIKIQDVKTSNGRVLLKGQLIYHILYIDMDGDSEVQSMNGQVEFEEYVNMNDVCNGDNVQVRWDLEDLSIDIINSRKISIKAILNIMTEVTDIEDEQVAVDVSHDGDVYTLESDSVFTELCMSRKDTYRIKDEANLPQGRETIGEVVYQEVIPEGIETRLLTDQLSIRGELRIITLYIGVEEKRLNAYEVNVPFQGTVDCNGCNENMISRVHVTLQDKDIQVRPDEDGEDRIIDIEAVLGLDIKVYREQEIGVLSDVYSTKVNILPEYKNVCIDNLIIKNNCKARIADKLTIDAGNPPVMQISSASGNVRIDEKRIVPGGIEVEGIVEIHIMYFTEGDECPIGSYKGAVPFTQVVEAKGIHEDCTFELDAMTDMMSVMVIDSMVMEVKVVVGLDVIVFEHSELPAIVDWQITERDMDALSNMPGITGYVVREGETLWNIAKEFQVTPGGLMDMNGLENEQVHAGDKLLIVKCI